jgi:hypothetical protein
MAPKKVGFKLTHYLRIIPESNLYQESFRHFYVQTVERAKVFQGRDREGAEAADPE